MEPRYQKRDCLIKIHLEVSDYMENCDIDIGRDHHSLRCGGDLQTSQFLYLKAIALNNFKATKEISDPKEYSRYYSNLDKELELMKFEM